ncbi:MAG: hypothetical protein MI923_04065 [Phycisphaerales bacterium]|nr:hypothetical protein [Phycisphaerales bacterium]
MVDREGWAQTGVVEGPPTGLAASWSLTSRKLSKWHGVDSCESDTTLTS